jgi:hypothetical protein
MRCANCILPLKALKRELLNSKEIFVRNGILFAVAGAGIIRALWKEVLII